MLAGGKRVQVEGVVVGGGGGGRKVGHGVGGGMTRAATTLGCQWCCCNYCDLPTFLPLAYPPRKLTYPPPPPSPRPPKRPPQTTTHHSHHTPSLPPDVAAAFLLSLDLRHALHRALDLDLHPLEHDYPSVRALGGSLGGLESALKYPDNILLPLPLLSIPPTAGTTTTTPTTTTTTTTLTTTTSSGSAATMTAYPSWLPYPLYGPEPGGGGNQSREGVGVGSGRGEGGGGGGGPDEEELGAYWDLLETEMRPIKPLPTCPESQRIFSEHKEMAGKYLVLQTEIYNLRQRKTTLEEKLSQAEKLDRLGSQRYTSKIRELENKRDQLRDSHSRLRQQLEQISARQQQSEGQDSQNHDPHLNLPLTPP